MCCRRSFKKPLKSVSEGINSATDTTSNLTLMQGRTLDRQVKLDDLELCPTAGEESAPPYYSDKVEVRLGLVMYRNR
jgi:hypothetical protein